MFFRSAVYGSIWHFSFVCKKKRGLCICDIVIIKNCDGLIFLGGDVC